MKGRAGLSVCEKYFGSLFSSLRIFGVSVSSTRSYATNFISPGRFLETIESAETKSEVVPSNPETTGTSALKKEFWMQQYAAFIEKYPHFPENATRPLDKHSITRYMKKLSGMGEQCPSLKEFCLQMRHIAVHHEPSSFGFADELKKQTINDSLIRKLPNHIEIMQSLKDLPVKEATAKYIEEVKKYCNDDTIQWTVSESVMNRWITLAKAAKVDINQSTRAPRQLKIPDWLLDTTPCSPKEKPTIDQLEVKRNYGQDFWKYHVKELVRMYPNFLRNYEHRISRGEIECYIAHLKRSGEACPSLRSFYRQIKHLLEVGSVKRKQKAPKEEKRRKSFYDFGFDLAKELKYD
mmetsp:Transcript_24400/g.37997  ORF Transcript_24400/g.37997 Transcript_24400/m.37997 type:complete len:350 (-) Transcript_24400:26-1075(-)